MSRRYSVEAVAWFSQRLASGQIRALRTPRTGTARSFRPPTSRGIQLMVDSMPIDFGTVLKTPARPTDRFGIQPTATAGAVGMVQLGPTICI